MRQRKFGSGNVVRWNDALWIVEEDHGHVCTLLSFRHARAKACPSEQFPYIKAYEDETGPADHRPDPRYTVDTIELVATSVQDLIVERVLRLLT